MTYAQHLLELIDALLAARPDLSQRRVSMEAGQSAGWVSSFMLTGKANMENADAVREAIGRLCPPGPTGDPVRRLLASLSAVRPEPKEDAA